MRIKLLSGHLIIYIFLHRLNVKENEKLPKHGCIVDNHSIIIILSSMQLILVLIHCQPFNALCKYIYITWNFNEWMHWKVFKVIFKIKKKKSIWSKTKLSDSSYLLALFSFCFLFWTLTQILSDFKK